MKHAVAILAFFLLSRTCASVQSQTPQAQEDFSQRYAESQKLYQAKHYSQAAQVLEAALQDPAFEEFRNDPSPLYDLACYQALAGDKDLALGTLYQAALNGLANSVESIGKDADLISLHGSPVYAQVLAIAKQRALLWRSNPALATPYVQNIAEDEKIAGLSTFWSEACFAFPFFDRHPEFDLNARYLQYLAKVRATSSTADYYRVIMRFAAELKDGHTNVYAPAALQDTFYARPALRTRLIDGKVVITEILDDALRSMGIKEGVMVTAIDGREVIEYGTSEVMPSVSASSEQDRFLRTFGYQLLSGPADKPITLTLQDASGPAFRRTVPRLGVDAPGRRVPKTSSFRMLAGGIAYLAVDEFESDQGAKDFLGHFAEISSAKALIIDVRRNGGGDSKNGDAILAMLADTPLTTDRWRTVDYRPAFRAWGGYPGWHRGESRLLKVDLEHGYRKPVAVLIGPATFSAGEDFVAAFHALHRGRLIGEATGGSTGQPITFALPGGGSARICTLDESFADGRAFEGTGIEPQIKVSQSMEDIRTGSDVVLERARVELLSDR